MITDHLFWLAFRLYRDINNCSTGSLKCLRNKYEGTVFLSYILLVKMYRFCISLPSISTWKRFYPPTDVISLRTLPQEPFLLQNSHPHSPMLQFKLNDIENKNLWRKQLIDFWKWYKTSTIDQCSDYLSLMSSEWFSLGKLIVSYEWKSGLFSMGFIWIR